MSQANQPDLGLSPAVSSFIASASRENAGIESIPFNFPSVGTHFARVTHTVGNASDTYFVKRFDTEKYFVPKSGGGTIIWRRPKTVLPPAELEHLYLELFRSQGCAVPRSQVIDNFTLAMEDCGSQSLEERLRGKDSDDQEQELAAIIPEQAKFAVAGRKIKVPSNALDKIEAYSNLVRDFTLHHNLWRPGASEEEVGKYLNDTEFLRKVEESQYFLGDNSDFHIIFNNNGKPMWVDIEKIKRGHQGRETAGIYFSPASRLSFEAIERLLFMGLRKEAELEEKTFDKGVGIEFLKSFYKDGVIECERRGTKIRELQMGPPEVQQIYERFVGRYEGYVNAASIYPVWIGKIRDRVMANGIFNGEEKTEFDRSIQAILNLMSK